MLHHCLGVVNGVNKNIISTHTYMHTCNTYLLLAAVIITCFSLCFNYNFINDIQDDKCIHVPAPCLLDGKVALQPAARILCLL